MQKLVVLIVLGSLMAGCSSKSTNDDNKPLVMQVTPLSMEFKGVATGAPPAGQPLYIANAGGDSLTCFLRGSSSRVTVERNRPDLAPQETETILVFIDLSGVAVGVYQDTVTILDVSAKNAPRYVLVKITATTQSTYATLEMISSSTDYQETIGNCDLYEVGCSWKTICHSNSGNTIEIFAYVAYGAGTLAEKQFAPISVSDGNSLTGALAFEACGSGIWWVKVGYRVDGDEYWVQLRFP